MALGSFDQWKVESLRLSVFADQVLDPAGKDWWRACAGTDPDATSKTRQTGEYSESGPYEGGTLQLKCAFNRVDWLFGPGQGLGPQLPVLPFGVEAIGAALRPFDEWMRQSGINIVRVAVGAVLLKPAPALIDATSTILEHVPALQLDPKLARDINIQLNYPRKLNSAEGEILNQVWRWASVSATLVTIQPAVPIPHVITEYFCRAESDFNTSDERKVPFAAGSLDSFVTEVTGMMLGQLQNGVKP